MSSRTARITPCKSLFKNGREKDTHTHTQRERLRETERKRDRHRERDRVKERQRDKETKRNTQRDRQTQRDRDQVFPLFKTVLQRTL